MKLSKENKRQRIHLRIRKRLKGTAERPRLAVYRSNKDIYCQLIDDVNSVTIAATSSKEIKEGNKSEQATNVGFDQPVIEPADAHDNGLVETPEEKPKPRPRKPRAPRKPKPDTQPSGDTSPEAAE